MAVRIGEILEHTNENNWKWVPSKENVADDATKYKNNCDFSSTGRWYKVPTFLYQNPLSWPKNSIKIITTDLGNEEVKECYLHCETTSLNIVEYTRFSGWKRLLRTLMYVFRFMKFFVLKWRKQNSPQVFSLDEKKAAAWYLYKQCQIESFPNEYAALTRAKNTQNTVDICKSSPLYTPSPYLDESGVIRIGGRVDAIENVSIDPAKGPLHHSPNCI